MNPLVSVICLCHNHHLFLKEAIDSVLSQTYPNIEIIVVDDASTDNSKGFLKEICLENNLQFIDIKKNVGNCAAFNKAFKLSKGKYVIDFATDDVMMPQRVTQQVHFFEKLNNDYGVVFSNAQIIDEKGFFLKTHYKEKAKVTQGDIYSHVLSTYFISPPTMMIKREVLETLGGYDENLAYEDFDFWVRSSRNFKYAYQDKCLTKVRKVPQSLSARLYTANDKQLLSTYKVCLKATTLNRNSREKNALIKRLRYEARHAIFTANFTEAQLFFDLLYEQDGMDFPSFVFEFMGKNKIILTKLRFLYFKIRYGT